MACVVGVETVLVVVLLVVVVVVVAAAVANVGAGPGERLNPPGSVPPGGCGTVEELLGGGGSAHAGHAVGLDVVAAAADIAALAFSEPTFHARPAVVAAGAPPESSSCLLLHRRRS